MTNIKQDVLLSKSVDLSFRSLINLGFLFIIQ